jgi:hypothetical protein
VDADRTEAGALQLRDPESHTPGQRAALVVVNRCLTERHVALWFGKEQPACASCHRLAVQVKEAADV